MNRIANTIDSTLWSTATGIVTYLFGGFDALLQLLAVAILCNFLAGYWLAYKEKRRDPDKMFMGLVRVAVALMVIVLAHRVDHTAVDPTDTLRNVSIFLGAGYYGQSFFKNAKALGFPVPKWLVDAIADPTGMKNKK